MGLRLRIGRSIHRLLIAGLLLELVATPIISGIGGGLAVIEEKRSKFEAMMGEEYVGWLVGKIDSIVSSA